MKIKKYTGKTFQEAFDKMKKELGGDAIILNSRKVKKGGRLDYLNGPGYHEVTAGIDTQTRPEPGRRRVNEWDSNMYQPLAPDKNYDTRHDTTENEKNSAFVSNSDQILQHLGQIGDLKDEVSEMKKVLEQVSDFLKYSRMPALPQVFKNALKQLTENEVHEELAKAIVQTVYARTDSTNYNNSKAVLADLYVLLKQMLKIAPPLENARRNPYVVTLIGPTGVGKTTTIAKLAATMKLFNNKKVGLISADTYRIAAIEQLQTFANIANIPMDVVYTPEEMQQSLQKFQDRELILIDTVGRSQKNNQQLKDLQLFIDAGEPDEVHLVLSMTSGLRTLLDVVRRFKPLRPNRIIFSKCDESSSPGLLLNVLYKHQIPVSYLTTGQTVPNDIMKAEKDRLARWIYSGVLKS